MSRSVVISVFIILFALITIHGEAGAQWTKIGAPVCTETGTQLRPKSASDGNGGAVIAFRTTVLGVGNKIYAQKINAGGELQWPAAGVAVGTDTLSQFDHNIIDDGAGGCIVVWSQTTAGSDYHVYAQRIDAGGTILWGASGVRVCTATTHQNYPEIVSDEAGGAFVVWTNSYTGSPTAQDIFAQRLSPAGNRMWIDTGFTVCNATQSQFFPVVAGDGARGVLVAWTDLRSGTNYDVYGQCVDGNATIKWGANGEAIVNSADEETSPSIISDGAGGAYIAWDISTVTNGNDIFITRIDSDGSTHSGYQTYGESITWTTGNQQWPTLIAAENGGVIVIWLDQTVPQSFYAQRVPQHGYPLWADGGVPLISSSDLYTGFEAVSDGVGGAIVSFNLVDSYPAARALRVTGAGDLLWDTNGMLLTEGNNYQAVWGLVPTSGGVIATFDAFGPGGNDCFAQRIDINGHWGDPAPVLTAAQDVPYDQGGNVLLTWMRSYLDDQPYYLISHYSVWRKMDGGVLPSPASAYKTVELSDIGPDFDGRAIRITGTGAAAAAWEWIKNVEALMLPEYSYSAPTYYDSIGATGGTHEFAVAAHKTTPMAFWMSGPLEGYSVDNLAPAAPQALLGEQQEEPVGLRVSWTHNGESDLGHYNVYKASNGAFVPGAGNLAFTSTDNSVFDNSWVGGDGNWYKVCAVDIHGNIGTPAALNPADIITATELQTFAATSEDDAIVISWTLAEAGEFMEFRIYRSGTDGEFSLLADASIESDGMSFVFVDSGIEAGETYRYRVDVTDEEGTRSLFETRLVSVAARALLLFQNHPNPFNPSTVIGFTLPARAVVVIDIFDIAGKKMRTIDFGVTGAGKKSTKWNGTNDNGNPVSSGVYFYRLSAGKRHITRKMVLLK